MFHKGCKVLHNKMPQWGEGTVMEDESDGRVRISFEHAGEKCLALDFAQIVKIGTAIGPILEIVKAKECLENIEVAGTYPLKYEQIKGGSQ